MGYITNNYFPLSTTQPHLPTHSEVSEQHQFITASSAQLEDRKSNIAASVTLRWNPTPEQITTLEEIYRSGTRTPTTEQIQNIASKLRKYGRIEGKNVFYWFQNHKARERLKRRRNEGCSISNIPHNKDNVKHSSSGDHGIDQTKICPSFPLTNPQQQDELVPASYNEDNNANNKDHGTTDESERATWRNLVTWSITQEPPREINMNENVNEDKEETKEIQTLNLFPVMENQEKTVRFIEKTKVNQVCCNYCYYYEFMPLKN